jgi:outer membrane protein
MPWPISARRPSTSKLALLAALTAVAAPIAHAQSDSEEAQPLWEFRFAAFGRYAPAYPGASKQDLTLLPLPYPVYRGPRLRFGEDFDRFAEGRVVRRRRVRLNVNFNVNFGEDSEELGVRTGMPDLDLMLEIGPELEINLNNRDPADGALFLALQARAGISFDGTDSSGRGYVVTPQLEYQLDQAFGSRNDLIFRWSPTWATEDYADYYYEVPAEFSTPSRPAFDAASGYIGSELRIGLERQINERLRFDSSIRLWVNNGAENRASPLFEDDHGLGVQAAFIWTLGASERREE